MNSKVADPTKTIFLGMEMTLKQMYFYSNSAVFKSFKVNYLLDPFTWFFCCFLSP